MTSELLEHFEFDSALPIGPQLHTALRRMIVTNVFKPGEPISVVGIAKALSISRQPIRDALIKLAEEGLVEIQPQRGTIVRKIDYDAVLIARFVREAIEADVIKLVTLKSNAKVVSNLRAQIREQRRVAKKNPLDFSDLDEKFHRSLAYFADKDRAWDYVMGLRSQLDRVRYLSLSHFPIHKLIDQHSKIVDEIESADVKGAEQAMRLHLQELLLDLPKILESVPDVFERSSQRRP